MEKLNSEKNINNKKEAGTDLSVFTWRLDNAIRLKMTDCKCLRWI